MKLETLSRRTALAGAGLLAGQLVLGGLTACNREPDAHMVPTTTPGVTTINQPAAGSVSANGVLQPADRVALSFGVEGRVESVKVEVGEHVEAQQMLATLDTAELERAVAEAELTLAEAELALEKLRRPPDQADVDTARAAVSDASAAYEEAQSSLKLTEYSVAVGDGVRAARQARDRAYNRYQTLLSRNEDQQRIAEAHDQYLDALGAYNRAVETAEYEMTTAENDVSRASHALQQAQTDLDQLLEGADELDIEAAQLAVQRAQLALERAETELAQATLVAPFDGIVSEVAINVDEWVGPSTPAAELIDVSHWRVETKNVGELEIGRVRVGQEALVRVNAFRGETLRGRVLTISPVAVVQQGDTTYTLTIELEPTDLNLRPGMTARVEIVAEP